MRASSGRAAAAKRARPSACDRSDCVASSRTRYSDSGSAEAEPLLERLAAFFGHQRVGVLAFRQEQEADLATFTRFGQRVLQGPPRRGAAGAIAIEGEGDFAHQAEDAFEMLGRRRGAERRDRVRHAELMQAHRIHVAFDDHQALERHAALPHFVQAVELAALVEQRGLG